MLWKHCIQSACGIFVQFTHKLYAVLPYYSDNSKLFIYPLQNRLHFRKRRCSLFFLGNTAFYHDRENQSSKKQKNCSYHRMCPFKDNLQEHMQNIQLGMSVQQRQYRTKSVWRLCTPSACKFPVIFHKNAREYIKYSLRFLFHLTKNLTTHLSHNLCAVLPKIAR